MNAVVTTPRTGLSTKIAHKYSVEPGKLLDTLKVTAFKTEKPVSNEAMMALLIVADQYNLNPFTREIFAFEDRNRGIVPVVSVDGWARILNDHAQFDGLDFAFAPTDGSAAAIPEWCECTIYRKDRTHPIKVREYFSEVKRDTGPWKSHPRRMLRHKSLIQCARVALGFSGIYDEDEAQRIAAGEVILNIPAGASRTEQAKALLGKEEPPKTVDLETGEIVDAPEFPISDESAEPPK